jgi:deferrochelatase/peroxidase EfeB
MVLLYLLLFWSFLNWDILAKLLANSIDHDGVTKFDLPEEEFVISKGGEYFFCPSIEALGTKFVGL